MGNRVLRDWTDSEKVSVLSAEAERFFTRLIMKVDDFGCYVRNPRLIRAALFPLLIDEVTELNIISWMNECTDQNLIKCYDVDGKQYLQIIDFGQRLRVKKSKYPLPNGQGNDLIKNSYGHIYLIGVDYNSPVKIGFSLNPWARLKEISTGNHSELNVLLSFKGEKKLESSIHKELKEFRTKNEWFLIPKVIVDILIEYSKAGNFDIIESLRSNTSLLRSSLEVETEVETESETEVEEETNGSLADENKIVPREAIELTEAICDYFDVKKILTSKIYNSIDDFVTTVTHRNEIEIVAAALKKYKVYKARSQEAKHNPLTWIGTKADHYNDGKWREIDWDKKVKNYEQQTVKRETTAASAVIAGGKTWRK